MMNFRLFAFYKSLENVNLKQNFNKMNKPPKILNYKNLNLEKYEYLQPHKTPFGNYQSICNYRLNKNELTQFYFETPKLKTVSGIVRIDNKYYMDLELSQSGDASSFYDFIIKNDEYNISVCHKNSKDWFGHSMPLNIIENYYKSTIVLKPHGQLPVLRVRLPSYKGNILTEIYNVRKEKVNDILSIQEGDQIVGIIEYVGLSFLSQMFTPIYEIQKIKIFKDNDYRAIPSGYIFSDVNEKINLDVVKLKTDDIILDKPIPTPTPTPVQTPVQTPISQPYVSQPILEPLVQIINKQVEQPKQEKYKVITNDFIDDTKTKDEVFPLSKPGNSNSNKTSVKNLYEIVKNTTLKDIIDDNNIFMFNYKLFNDTNIRKQNLIKKLTEIKTEQPLDTNIHPPIEQFNNIVENQVKESVSPTSPISIQNVNEININLDYNLEEKHNTNDTNDTNDTNFDISESKKDSENNLQMDIEMHIPTVENMTDQTNQEMNQESISDSDSDSDQGIDYDILNDLEVVVFDE